MTQGERVRLAQQAAESIHRQTGADLVVVVCCDDIFTRGEGVEPTMTIGAWVPDKDILTDLLRHALRKIDADEATVIDRTVRR